MSSNALFPTKAIANSQQSLRSSTPISFPSYGDRHGGYYDYASGSSRSNSLRHEEMIMRGLYEMMQLVISEHAPRVVSSGSVNLSSRVEELEAQVNDLMSLVESIVDGDE